MYHIPVCNYNYQSPDYFHINRPEGTGDYLLLFFKTPMNVTKSGITTTTKENAMILYKAGSPQNYQAVKAFKNSFVHFTCDNLDTLLKYKIPLDEIFYISNTETVDELFCQIAYEYSMRHCFYEEKMETLLTQLFIEVSRQLILPKETPAESHDLIIQFYRARFFILNQIDWDWDIESMAALTNYSCSQFYYHYKQLFSISPKAELIEARISRAKTLLKSSNASIGDIATMCGFKNHAHFTRIFRDKCGCTPSEFVKGN